MFQSAPPCGERRVEVHQRHPRASSFNPRPPAESDGAPLHRQCPTSGFNPRPPAESDPTFRSIQRPPAESDRSSSLCESFQSAPPCGERPHHAAEAGGGVIDVSIRAPLRRATPRLTATDGELLHVSIRAPLRRATRRRGRGPESTTSFNPRPPAESDDRRRHADTSIEHVSIRAPLRRATRWCPSRDDARPGVSIRAPLRRATRRGQENPVAHAVSIRAPLRRATLRSSTSCAPLNVSIRAPLRRATRNAGSSTYSCQFQSAPPCGERRPTAVRARVDRLSVSIRAPLRRATSPNPTAATRLCRPVVSIRAPLRRATCRSRRHPCAGEPQFQSAPPCGERLARVRGHVRRQSGVSIRAPLRRATASTSRRRLRLRIASTRGFNPRPPAESDPVRLTI